MKPIPDGGKMNLPNKSNQAIGNSAFRESGLYSIIIPDKVSSIGSSAFYECKNLQSMTVPKSITIRSSSIFCNCILLRTITYKGTIAGWNDISKNSYRNSGTPTYTIRGTNSNLSKS